MNDGIDRKARDNDRSRGWWDSRLALGICGVCRRALPEGATRAWHPECFRVARQGWSYAEIRRMAPAAIARLSHLRRQRDA